MSAQPPILDSRSLQEILEQLRSLAGTDLPEWTPPLEGDAGTMLQRIFARLLEIAFQRLNQAPEKNFFAFLDTMGVSLLSPSPARAPLTFSLTPGSPATLVPQGTQTVTRPVGPQTSVTFETEDDLTVLPAQITMGFTIDPTWDRYTDQSAVLAGQSVFGFTPFVGTKGIPHILYLGDNFLLEFSQAATVEVGVTDGPLPAALQDIFQTLIWQYRSNGILKTVNLTTSGIFQFNIPDTIDQEAIQGVGLEQDISNRWLLGRLAVPFPDARNVHDLKLNDLVLKVSGGNLLPELAFYNTAPLDVTREFLPFGEAPKLGDVFYLGSREAFSKPGTQVTLNVEIKPSPPPSLVLEYWNGRTWTKMPRANIVEANRKVGFTFQGDGTNSFTREGPSAILLSRPVNMALTEIDDQRAFWFRIRMADGNYRGAPLVTRFELQSKSELQGPP